MKIAVLGGYANTGLKLARLLATAGRADLVLLGRGEDRLLAAAEGVGREARRQVSWRATDASSGPSLRAALGGANLLVVASSTTAHAATVGRAALEARGLCFITDGQRRRHLQPPVGVAPLLGRQPDGVRRRTARHEQFGLRGRGVAPKLEEPPDLRLRPAAGDALLLSSS
jgi:hypothetical protein